MSLRVGVSVVCVAVILGGCGGKSANSGTDAQGGAREISGGQSGAGTSANGGATSSANGGVDGGGALASGGSLSAADCAKTTCPAIPSSCRQIVQDPNACCPACTDTGCGECALIECAEGTHSETIVGDCCPSCVADPPDPCVQGQKNYAELRAQMLEKYSSTGCKNSADCALVIEDTACAFVCQTALPSTLASSFVSNLESAAMSDCATCPPTEPVPCVALFPACVNGKCVGVPPR